jgi:hypothetical protein
MRPKRGEQGQATVEFAIVLPLVLLLVVGLIEFGKAFNYWLSLNHLANEGSRWVAVDRLPVPAPNGTNSPTVTDYETYLRNQVNSDELQQKLIAEPDSIRLCRGGTGQVGDEATVIVKTPYSFPFGIGSVTLAGKSTVRLEQPVTWTSEAEC